MLHYGVYLKRRRNYIKCAIEIYISVAHFLEYLYIVKMENEIFNSLIIKNKGSKKFFL